MGKIGKRKYIRQTIRNGNGVTNPKQLASCYGKIRMTKEAAYDRAKGISTMKAYHCSFCGHYHVGRRG